MIYKDPKAPIENRVDDILLRMTLEEKVLQLSQGVLGYNNNINNLENQARTENVEMGSYIYYCDDAELRNKVQYRAIYETRLGIPILFGYDVIHGFRTVFPIPLAQACSWNPDLVQKACAEAAREAKNAGIDWTFSPMIDVSHDARWGRISECYGEDPYTNAVFGVGAVRGYQGKNLNDSFSIAACLKHYVGYGASESGRDYVYSEISRQTLWDTYLVPYKACVEAGAATLMSAFNDISGVPASANSYTLTDILKKKWKHHGFVVSDWDAVRQLINQGFAKDEKEACLKAFAAGVEMDMVDQLYVKYLKELVNEGKINMSQIDDAVKRVLRLKFQLGLFENPFGPKVPTQEQFLTASAKKVALELAEQSIVLLKNKEILPVSKEIKRIALIGPLAKEKEHIMGSWNGRGKAEDMESIYEGFLKEFGNSVQLNYAKGCEIEGTQKEGFEEALKMAEKSDIILLCLGEKGNWSGENASRSTIALPSIQEELMFILKKTSKPIILILSSGRPLELIRLEPLADAIIEIWQPGIATGSALAHILSGKVNPSGKLSASFPLTTGQVPIYYSKRSNARKGTQGLYQDISSEPLYPFAHGLSYTTFEYDSVKLTATKIGKNQKITASVKVKNTGSMDGFETIHWFISDPYASITRPQKELKFFQKKFIKKGETITFQFEIDPERDLSFPDSNGDRILEAGDFYLMVKDQKILFELL